MTAWPLSSTTSAVNEWDARRMPASVTTCGNGLTHLLQMQGPSDPSILAPKLYVCTGELTLTRSLCPVVIWCSSFISRGKTDVHLHKKCGRVSLRVKPCTLFNMPQKKKSITCQIISALWLPLCAHLDGNKKKMFSSPASPSNSPNNGLGINATRSTGESRAADGTSKWYGGSVWLSGR